jgi:hypothetical protein
VITLGQSVGDPLVLSAEGSPKFEITPAVKAGYLAAKVVKPIIKHIERPRRPLAEQNEGPKSDRFGRTTLE